MMVMFLPLMSFKDNLVCGTRLEDGLAVLLKCISPSQGLHQIKVAKFFSTESVISDPRNHCIPLLDTIEVPSLQEMTILVMPFVWRSSEPSFLTVGEAIEYFRQIVEVSV